MVSDTILLKKPVILHHAFTVAVTCKCQYCFRYNNYKLKAVLAHKTSGCYTGYISVWKRPISTDILIILPKTIDFSMRFWEITAKLVGFISLSKSLIPKIVLSTIWVFSFSSYLTHKLRCTLSLRKLLTLAGSDEERLFSQASVHFSNLLRFKSYSFAKKSF